jgi:hypothetical protein
MSNSNPTTQETEHSEDLPPVQAAKPREKSGSQRTQQLARHLGVTATDLAHRVRRSSCALCGGTLSFMRRYGEKKHYCATCEPRIDVQTREAIDDLERYL